MNYKKELIELQNILIEEQSILETLDSMNVDYRRMAQARLDQIRQLKLKYTLYEINNTQKLIQVLEQENEPIKKKKRLIHQPSPEKKEKHKSFNLLAFIIVQQLVAQNQPEMAMVVKHILR